MAATETHTKDNLFGVCDALGRDFGFNPLILRMALAVAFLFAPVWVAVGYFVVGAAVLAARTLFPDPDAAPRAPSRPWIVPAAPVVAADEVAETPIEYAKAA